MKQIIVTTSWDDGHILDVRVADLLRKYSLPGTFYISPFNREFPKESLLSSEQIIDLSKEFEIGAHTLTHPILYSDKAIALYRMIKTWFQPHKKAQFSLTPRIPLDEAQYEITGSKEYLEELIGNDIVSFCYPDGRNDSSIQNLVKEAGFIYARTTERFFFDQAPNNFASPTSIHTYNQFQDTFKIARISNWHPKRFMENMRWNNLAKTMFDHVVTNGGIYHLWGHSWMIDEANQWDWLEEVFDYISDKPNVTYIVNGNLVDMTHTYEQKISNELHS